MRTVAAPVQRLDTSERGHVYLLPVRGGAYLRLAPGAVQLLRAVENGATFDELARTARRSDGGAVSPGEIETAYGAIIDRIAEAERQADTAGAAFWLRWRLIPARLVEKIAAVGAVAYHPVAVALLALLIGAGGWLALAVTAPRMPAASGDFWLGYLVFLAGLLAHEIGHASACARFKARPSEIGFVVYLLYPAFYSNVSAAWALKRWQRVVVDLGGVYFELAFGALCAIAFAWTGWPPLSVTLVLIGASCVLSLNPILKFDGYWVVADALGVTNLSRQPAMLVQRLWRRSRGQSVPPLPWPVPIAWTLAAYTVVSFAFLVWFASALGPLAADVAQRYPALVLETMTAVARGAWPEHLGELVTATYVLLFALLMALRLARPVVETAARRIYGR